MTQVCGQLILKDLEREIIVRYLANRYKDQKIPNDSEAKPFPEYLKYFKVANGREKGQDSLDDIYSSESNDALYCIPCVLFYKEQKRPSLSALNSRDKYKMSDVKWRRISFQTMKRINSTENTTLMEEFKTNCIDRKSH